MLTSTLKAEDIVNALDIEIKTFDGTWFEDDDKKALRYARRGEFSKLFKEKKYADAYQNYLTKNDIDYYDFFADGKVGNGPTIGTNLAKWSMLPEDFRKWLSDKGHTDSSWENVRKNSENARKILYSYMQERAAAEANVLQDISNEDLETYKDDLNKFDFPIIFCEEFINKFDELQICFEDVFEAFMKVKSIHSEYKLDDEVYNEVNKIDDQNSILKEDGDILMYEALMKYYAKFLKRYLDNDLIDSNILLCNKYKIPKNIYSYIDLAISERLEASPEYFPKTIDKIWFNQFIERYSNNPTKHLIEIFRYDNYEKRYRKYFEDLVNSNLITENNYRTKDSVKLFYDKYNETRMVPARLSEIKYHYEMLSHLHFKPFLKICDELY